VTRTNWSSFFNLNNIKKKILKEKQEDNIEVDKEDESWTEKKSEATTEHLENDLVSISSDAVDLEAIFGESSGQQWERIREASPYSNLPGYKLIHVIIKSRDDLRQECFAMQLLQEFDKIFRMEELPVRLSPY
jgi:phosphatidylinositol kinase/protein kinase (PI-3  family)